MEFFSRYFETLIQKIMNVDHDMLKKATEMIQSAGKAGGKTIIVGNGGSAATASHISVDLSKNAGMRAVNFNEADLITCFSNDYGYERWVEKAIEFYANPGDLAILISSSGTSKNIINGGLKAKNIGLKIITFSGFDANNTLRQLGDINFWVDSKAYNIIEMVHAGWLAAIVDRIIGYIEYPA